jgi:hypothetical protein
VKLPTIGVLLIASACGSAAHPPYPPPAPVPAWRVPDGWRSETIPFPLDFAPSLAHRGIEELRFAPGFFDPAAPGYWSYAFVWRTEDAATLDAAKLGDELTVYFRGLIAAVDKDGRITARDTITATATPEGATRFALRAHVFDAFKTALPLDLEGTAERRACETGALWVFVLARAGSPIRAELDALAKEAECGQPEPPKPKK